MDKLFLTDAENSFCIKCERNCPNMLIRTTFIHKIKLCDFHYQTRIIYSTITKLI